MKKTNLVIISAANCILGIVIIPVILTALVVASVFSGVGECIIILGIAASICCAIGVIASYMSSKRCPNFFWLWGLCYISLPLLLLLFGIVSDIRASTPAMVIIWVGPFLIIYPASVLGGLSGGGSERMKALAKKILVVGCLISICLVGLFCILMSARNMWQRRGVPGYLLGKTYGGGIVVLSPLTETILVSREEGGIPAAPVIDAERGILYYMDTGRRTVMAWASGQQAPKVVCSIPAEYDPTQSEWILVHPNGTRILYPVIYPVRTYSGDLHLVQCDVASGSTKVVFEEEFVTSVRPAWIDESHILIQSGGVIKILDIDTGKTQTVMRNVSAFALSPSGTRLFVREHQGGIRFNLYKYPEIELIKEFPSKTLRGSGNLHPDQCFLGERHLVFTKEFDPMIQLGTFMLDLDTGKCVRISRKTLHPGAQYLPAYPQWVPGGISGTP